MNVNATSGYWRAALRVIALIVTAASTPAIACDQAGAIVAMRAISQAQTERLRGTPSQQQIAARMAQETAGVGTLLAEERYADACNTYAEIAAKYGVDLEAYEARLAPLGGNKPGECDTVAASLRIREAYESFGKQADTSGMSPVQTQNYHKQFSTAIDKATTYVQTDPARACAMVADVLTKYGID